MRQLPKCPQCGRQGGLWIDGGLAMWVCPEHEVFQWIHTYRLNGERDHAKVGGTG